MLAITVSAAAILVARFTLNVRRAEALVAIIPIGISLLAYACYWVGWLGEDMRSTLVRAVFPIFILSPAINSVLDIYVYISRKVRSWALMLRLRKPNH